ncbi:hypothetical protein H112_01147 [Trichophyton rubrum D6]|uniref:Uncharacterized protein n=2 Tax=Trichophyton rubrum TaxID=5551 RepID=A0A080WPE5_TRIRC|nr:uncharacterized protein TERG_12563 [Trichophyton rubrum CBS 118892]EZF26794.1 hypothetical protein H100_01140 [Trichophyton rubrum MR850]EZF45842.1 hypothetical protein H102_01137 [Trichophyton rubrum CBS 100081]EZF56475.1 hypothetical protein H103_01144 [Trichophyton rubrum CBS 288.86]EZF67113.1 hypothetical protein H104_01130 [Trichophyton rubrum CBS 289.86]EZF88460.1 hypothetical protein H110_01147 [Trichophyton rubrum MR1448]EZF99272.1 hypothetical protein H113_01147 [Trichophyton rubr
MTTSGIDIGPFPSYPATDKGGLSFILDAGTAVEKSISFSSSSSSSSPGLDGRAEEAEKGKKQRRIVLIRSGGRAKVNNPTVSFAFFTLFHISPFLFVFLSLSLSSLPLSFFVVLLIMVPFFFMPDPPPPSPGCE